MLVNDEQFEIQNTVLPSGSENCITVGYPARLYCINFMDFYTRLYWIIYRCFMNCEFHIMSNDKEQENRYL